MLTLLIIIIIIVIFVVVIRFCMEKEEELLRAEEKEAHRKKCAEKLPYKERKCSNCTWGRKADSNYSSRYDCQYYSWEDIDEDDHVGCDRFYPHLGSFL